jgi:hypothetical protein
MMLKVSIFVEVGNRAIEDGSLARAMQSTNECLKPETAYVLIGEGGRTSLFCFDMQDVSQIPWLAEPLFRELNAAVSLSPMMNVDDLQKGLPEAAKAF